MLKQMIIISLIGLGIFIIFMYVWQRHLIYFPSKEKPQLERFGAQDMTELTLITRDGLRLSSWYKAAHSNHPTIVYLHGNAGHIGYRVPLVRPLMDEGFGLLLLEYRGYGGNPGQPTEQGLYEDGRAAIDFLCDKGLRPQDIVLYGESLGTGIATQLALEYDVCALILQSPYTSLATLAKHHYPWILVKPWDQFDSMKRITTIHTPLLILHGAQDKIVPVQQALELYHTANEPKTLHRFEQQGHNDLWSAPEFTPKVIQFIEKHCH